MGVAPLCHPRPRQLIEAPLREQGGLRVSNHRPLGCGNVLGGLVVHGCWGCRDRSRPTARRPPGYSESPRWLFGGDRVLGGLVVNGCWGCRGPGWPNDLPSRPARAGGLLLRERARNTGSRGVGPCQSSGVEIRAQPGWRSEEFFERSEGHGWPQQASARWHGPTPSRGCDEPAGKAGSQGKAGKPPRAAG